jgi:hypothetical protein
MRQAEWDKTHVWRVLGTLYMQELEKTSIARLPTSEALLPARLQHRKVREPRKSDPPLICVTSAFCW